MTFVLLATVWHYVFGILIFFTSVFLILLVLVQRGRGGGLTGALGGMGGQSAFGTKAGDVFTRITMVTAAIWILLCMGAIWKLGSYDPFADVSDGEPGLSAPESGEPEGGAGDSGAGGEGDGMGATDSGGADTSDSSGTTAPEDSSGGDDN